MTQNRTNKRAYKRLIDSSLIKSKLRLIYIACRAFKMYDKAGWYIGEVFSFQSVASGCLTATETKKKLICIPFVHLAAVQ